MAWKFPIPLENSRILIFPGPLENSWGVLISPQTGSVLWLPAATRFTQRWAEQVMELLTPHCNCCTSYSSLRKPVCRQRYSCEGAVWQLESFRWVGFEFFKQEREFLSWTASKWISFQGWMPIKSLLSKISILTKVRVCSSKKYLWFAADVYRTWHQKTNNIFHLSSIVCSTIPKISFSTDHITITYINLWYI